MGIDTSKVTTPTVRPGPRGKEQRIFGTKDAFVQSGLLSPKRPSAQLIVRHLLDHLEGEVGELGDVGWGHALCERLARYDKLLLVSTPLDALLAALLAALLTVLLTALLEQLLSQLVRELLPLVRALQRTDRDLASRWW